MWNPMADPEVVTKATLAAASVPAANYVVPMWGAPLSAFGLAALGSIFSYAWTPPEKSKRVFFFKLVSVTLFSVALVVVMPDILGWNLSPESQPPMAFIVATFGRWIIPALKKVAPTMANAVAGMFGNRGGYSGSDYDSSSGMDYPEESEYQDPDYPHRRKKPRSKSTDKPTDQPPEGY